MFKYLFIIGLVFVSFLVQGCNPVISQNSKSEIKSETPQLRKDEVPKQQKVEFKGVSFSYNPQIFGKVKSEEVAERPLEDETHKPSYVTPKQRLFAFELATDFSEMYLTVSLINDFPRMYAIDPLSVKGAIKDNENLRKVLKDKNFRVENQIPYLPFTDASQSFQAKVKHCNFQNGQGILFLTFWETQYELPSNRQLRYVFEGLTNDGKYYVLAQMPVSVAFLPEDDTEEFEGYKIPWSKLKDEAEMKRFEEVKKEIGKRLENLKPNEFEPNLNYFEEMISSLKVEK